MENNNFELYKSMMQKMGCIGRLHRSIFEKYISSLGIHQSQHYLLVYIAKHGEIGSQKQLAERFGITPAAIARTLKALEAEGYIERTNIANDGRLNKIIITEKGKNIVTNSYIMFSEIDSSIFSDFSNEEIESFNLYLDKIKNKLNEMYIEGCDKNEKE